MIDEELVSPDAFALAVRSRASFLARHSGYDFEQLRRYAQLTLLLGIGLDEARDQLHERGFHGAYRWAITREGGGPAV